MESVIPTFTARQASHTFSAHLLGDPTSLLVQDWESIERKLFMENILSVELLSMPRQEVLS